MKLLLFVLAVLFIAIGVTLYAMDNPGYVLIARAPWSVEMPLTLFVVLEILAIVVSYAVIQVTIRLLNIPRDVARWRQLRRERRAHESLVHGVLHLLEGNFVQAEKRLITDLRYSDSAVLNYLAAAYCAHAEGDLEKRTEFLSLAHKARGSHDLAAGLLQAQLHIQGREFEQALATLTQLRIQTPAHPPMLRLLARVYRDLKDWTNLANLIPELRRRKALPAEAVDRLEVQTHRELLMLPLPAGSVRVLEKAWESVPKALRSHPALLETYAHQLLKQGERDRAEALLGDALAKQWHENLVELYGQLRSSNPAKQLATAEGFAAAHPNDAALLLALGRLAQAAGNLPKAREYLTRATQISDRPETHAALATILEDSGDAALALKHYRRCAQPDAETARRKHPEAKPRGVELPATGFARGGSE